MTDMDVNSLETENPFSVFAQQKTSPWRSLIFTIKLLVFAIVALALSVWAHQEWTMRQFNQLIDAYDSQTEPQRIATLEMIAQYDAMAIEQLVISLDDPSPAVCDKAASLIDEMQQRWMTFPSEQRNSNNLALATSLASSQSASIHVRRLAEKLIRDASEKPNEISIETSRLAASVLTARHNVDRDPIATTAIAQVAPITARSPLTIENAHSNWTQWPPESDQHVAQVASAPTVLRGRVTAVDELRSQPVILHQSERYSVGDPTVNQPTAKQPLGTPSIQPIVHQASGLDIKSVDQAAANLASPSRLVRLKSIHFLSQQLRTETSSADADRIRNILRNHLPNETDLSAEHRIREALMQNIE